MPAATATSSVGLWLFSEQGQPMALGNVEDRRGEWVRNSTMGVSRGPEGQAGVGCAVSFLTLVSHFSCLLNKGLSLLKEQSAAHPSRPPWALESSPIFNQALEA